MSALLELADYRRTVAAMYAAARDGEGAPVQRWRAFVAARDRLFAEHPQSALEADARTEFTGLSYYPYRRSYRVEAELDEAVVPDRFEVTLRDDGRFAMRRAALLHFTLPSGDHTLTLFVIEGYGGGLFLPFRDTTNGRETYGGGRYLVDSHKHADLGAVHARPILDFNFAYHPSCFYSPRWDCPLSPPENRLEVPIPVGERSLP